MDKSKKDINRRQFLRNGAISVTALTAVGLGANYLSKKHDEAETHLLRPPGAVDENTFLYACIKCGLCVQICPISAVKLAGIGEALSYGTPYIDPREQACDFSCDAMQCVETCPSPQQKIKDNNNRKTYEKISSQHYIITRPTTY